MSTKRTIYSPPLKWYQIDRGAEHTQQENQADQADQSNLQQIMSRSRCGFHGTSWTIGAAVHPDYRLLVAAELGLRENRSQ